MSTTPRVSYQTHPGQYRHWKMSFDGPIATLAADFDENAGLRPGYKLKLNSYDLGVDIELNDAINRIRGPFNVNGPAILAGIAAIEDHAHQERAREHNDRWLAWLTQEMEKLGLTVTPSVANFLLIHFPESKGRTAKDADAFLTARGLILRQVGSYKLPNALRMTVGSEEANRLVVAALKEFLGKP